MSESAPTVTKDDETKKASSPLNGQKFAGDGVMFKAKLIGMEDVTIDRDEKICLESMFKLKAIVRARGEHKQRIQINLTTSAVKITDDTTKASVASHEIERISFVVLDPRDNRAFGYIYNTADDRHQFWAIKTERPAAATVLALKELFEFAFEQYTNSEKAQETAAVSEPTAPATPVTTPAPVSPPPQPVPESVLPAKDISLLDENDWQPSPPITVRQPAVSLFDFDPPVSPPAKPTAAVADPLADLFGGLSTNPPPAAAAPPTSSVDPLLDVFASHNPTPSNQFGNFAAQPLQPNPTALQQPASPLTPTPPAADLLRPTSPVAPPTVTSPFADLDFFGNISTTTAKPTKESFFPAASAPKTMQQLMLEKQT